MKLLADEGVDVAIVARLRLEGHDILYIAEVAPGITDNAVLELANGEGRILLTADKDFGELTFRLRLVAFGILLVRLSGLPSADKVHAFALAIDEHGEEMTHAFSVISPGLLRIRAPITDPRSSAVLVSEDDWRAAQETLHLVSIPSMRESILDGMAIPVDELEDKLDI